MNDLTGKKFSRLTVLSRHGLNKQGSATWLVKCDCGNHKVISSPHLTTGSTVSCGCWRAERLGDMTREHGDSGSTEFKRWLSLIGRCNNPSDKAFGDYGGRGIKVCERWMEYENFLSDMGRCPSKEHTIDRVDNDGGYNKANCRWATKTEQNNNRRSNVVIEHDGRKMTATQWSKEIGVKYTTILYRLNAGYDLKNIFSRKQLRHGPSKTL